MCSELYFLNKISSHSVAQKQLPQAGSDRTLVGEAPPLHHERKTRFACLALDLFQRESSGLSSSKEEQPKTSSIINKPLWTLT